MYRFSTLFVVIAACARVSLAEETPGLREHPLAAPRPADAVEVFRCDFDDDSWDVNYDKWPDRWTRHQGSGYPHYVKIGIGEAPSLSSGRSLQIHLDGAQAIVGSPPIRVIPKFSYFLELKIKLTAVQHSRVSLRVEYTNNEGVVRQSFRVDDIEATGEWTRVTVGPERPKYPDIDRAMIWFETERSKQGDLDGVVSIGEMWIGRLPSLDVTANNRYHVYTDPDDVVITCSLSGIRERNPEIRFQLLDASSHELGAKGVRPLDGQLIREERWRASDIVHGLNNHSVGFEGATQWRPEIREYGGYGFYKVQVEMLSSENGKLIDEQTITLVVIPDGATQGYEKLTGEFGLSLPLADEPLDFATLEQLLPLLGVNWVKLPIWFSPEHQERGDQIIQFAERLAANDIELIGVLEPPDMFEADGRVRPMIAERSMANIVSQTPERWLPLFDHIMTRLSLRVRWWQLGGDHDTGFVGYTNLVEQIREIRHHLYRFGQDVGLGLGWRWDTPLEQGPISWEFHQMASNPPLNSEQLDARLRASGEGWRLAPISPMAEDPSVTDPEERHVSRLQEFVKQIVVAKRHAVQGIFVTEPFSGPTGLMTADGKPGQLLLPWRTTATLLSGAEYMGRLQLPADSRNWLFRRPDGLVVMVLWNDHPVDEVLYLGDGVRIVDVWGKSSVPGRHGDRDVVPVGRIPKFVVGLNEAIAKWRMAVHFERERIPSIFEIDHDNTLMLRNTFAQGVGAKVSLFVPDRMSAATGHGARPSDRWQIRVPDTQFGVAAGGEHQLPMRISLDDAAIGEQPVRIDFEVSADRAEDVYRFSVWRSLEVGTGEIKIRLQSGLDPNGSLVIQQHMTNSSDRPISFKCLLRAPPRKRKRAQVFELGEEINTKTYTYSDGSELIGREITLRAEEIDGPRVLIKRLTVQPQPGGA